MAERDARGKFLKGNRASVGHGRPSKAHEQGYHTLLLNAITPDDWTRVVRAILKKARGGDVAAFKALAVYILGRPTFHIQGDIRAEVGMDLSTWKEIAKARREEVEGD